MRYLISLWMLLVLASCDAAGDASPSPADTGGAAPAVAPAGAVDARGADGGTREEPREARPVVVFFGTSLTAGLGLPSEDDTYVAHVRELAAAAGVPFDAVNAGVSGETSAAGLRRIDWVLQRPLDVLVIELGANDGLRGLDVGQLEENLRGIIRRTRDRYPDAAVVLVQMEAPPNLGERYVTAFRDVYPQLAREESVTLAPFLLDGVAAVPELNQSDGIHPTPEGHRRMAENLISTLLSTLEAQAPTSQTGAAGVVPGGIR